uniref:Uncharacterized protein n=1 Tax=viral metagenome TaxID=1070528 RepID=A0A6M3KKI2_9ZZZZ
MVSNGNGTNGLSKKREETCARIIKAIGESNGLLTVAAKKAGVGLTTVKRYASEFSSVHEAVLAAKERMLDFAESKLYEKIKNGDNACLIFYLKCQGKGRGYIERQEITGEGGGPIKTETKIIVMDDEAKSLTERALKGEGT